MKLRPAACAGLLAPGLSACASAVSETQSTAYIETDPENARNCPAKSESNMTACDSAVREAEAKRDKELKELEERRMRAKVAVTTAMS